MKLELSATTRKKVVSVSKQLGVSESELAEKAILLYIETMARKKLHEEFLEWDKISDNVLLEFEKEV